MKHATAMYVDTWKRKLVGGKENERAVAVATNRYSTFD